MQVVLNKCFPLNPEKNLAQIYLQEFLRFMIKSRNSKLIRNVWGQRSQPPEARGLGAGPPAPVDFRIFQ